MQIDKQTWDSMQDHAELHLQSLEQWVQVSCSVNFILCFFNTVCVESLKFMIL